VLAIRAMLALLCVAVGGCAPPIPCVARHGGVDVRSGGESRLADRTGKRQSRRCCAHQAVALRVEGHDGIGSNCGSVRSSAGDCSGARTDTARGARRAGAHPGEMALRRGDVADPAVPVLVIERISKRGHPADEGGQANERFSAREPVLAG
jgi:hypothetical protein